LHENRLSLTNVIKIEPKKNCLIAQAALSMLKEKIIS